MTTPEQYDFVIAECRALFAKKLSDYGSAWRIMRPQSITDQIFIKANRIRQIETTGVALVDEGIRPELIGIINYAVIGLIQLELGASDTDRLSKEEAIARYDACTDRAKELMMAKNHDYGEAWRAMRTQSYTDLILMKIFRTKEIEDNLGATTVSEGIDANYFDMMNYAVFGMIKMTDFE